MLHFLYPLKKSGNTEIELWATKWVKVIGKAVERPHCNQMKDERSKI